MCRLGEKKKEEVNWVVKNNLCVCAENLRESTFWGMGLELTFGRSFYIPKNNSHPLRFLVWRACAEVNAIIATGQSSSCKWTFDPPPALFVNNVTGPRVRSFLLSSVSRPLKISIYRILTKRWICLFDASSFSTLVGGNSFKLLSAQYTTEIEPTEGITAPAY